MVTVIPFLPPAGVRINVSTPAAGEGLPLQSAVTLLIALLIPCVVLLLLLNCVLLFYRLPGFNKKRRKKSRSQGRHHSERGGQSLENGEDGNATGESSTLSEPSQELGGIGSTISQGVDAALTVGKGQWSRDRPHCKEGLRKPDGTAGEQNVCSLRPTIRVTVSAASRLPREQPLGGRGPQNVRGWNQGRGSQGTVSSSDLEAGANQAPPNSPVTTPAHRVTPTVQYAQKTSTQRKLHGNQILIVSPLDSIHFEHASSIPHDQTALPYSANSSWAGPGLDSDFGASAGVSLRILSSDSDSCSYSWLSGLEWDYYDPGYKRRIQRRMQRHQFPVLCSKQYWV